MCKMHTYYKCICVRYLKRMYIIETIYCNLIFDIQLHRYLLYVFPFQQMAQHGFIWYFCALHNKVIYFLNIYFTHFGKTLLPHST